MAENGAPLSPPEPEVCEIVLPITIFELSDNDFLESEEVELTASEENSFFLISRKAEVVKESRGAGSDNEEHLNEGTLKVKHREKQATPGKVSRSKEHDEELPDTCDGSNAVSFQNAVDHSEPDQKRVTGFLDPKMQNGIEKDVKVSDFRSNHSCGQSIPVSQNTQNEGENNVMGNIIKVGITVSQDTDPAANKVVWESLPDPDRTVNYEGTRPLMTRCNETSKRPRKKTALSEETHQGNNSEDYPNVADENEQASPFVNGICLPGDFPENAGSLAGDSRAYPEPDGAGNVVPLEVTDCSERHHTQKTMNDSNMNAESDQGLQMKTIKEASQLCSKRNKSTSLTSTKKHAKTTGDWKCLLCDFKGTSSVCLKNHFCTMYKNKNHKIIQKSSSVSSQHFHKAIKKRETQKKERASSSNPGEDRRGKETDKERKKTKSKYDKFFSKLKKVLKPSESFCCKICSFVFSDPKDFSQHTKEHGNGPPYQCPQCEYASDDHSYFLNHLYWHAGSKLYQCNFCKFLSRHFSSVVEHSYIHTGASPYSCAVCPLTFTSSSGLNRHTSTHGTKHESNSLLEAQEKEVCPPETYVCNKCGIVFYTQVLLQSHKKYHLQGKSHDVPSINVKNCKTQGAAYEQEDISQEGRTHSPNISVWKKSRSFQFSYSCDQCGLVLHKKEHLVYHKAVHLEGQPSKNGTCSGQQSGGDRESPEVHSSAGPAAKLFKCLQCAYVTSSFSNLRIHFATHTGEKPFKCQDCDKSFRNSSHLKRHSLLHVRDRRRCSWCFFIGNTAEDLKLHEKTCKNKSLEGKRICSSVSRGASSGEQTKDEVIKRSPLWGNQTHSYKCEHCEYSTYTSNSLKIHTRIHTGEKPYACDVCQKKFRTSGHLKRHKLVHQEQVFNCSSCDYSASTWQSFKQHRVSHGKAHLQKKPSLPAKIHRCEKCSYSTIRKENLKIHFRIHTGEKPYKCPHCRHAFRTSSHLKKHLSTHVNLQCDKCDFSTLDKHVLQKHARTHKKKECPKDVYKCHKCRLTFSELCIFKAHKKKHKESGKRTNESFIAF